MSDASESDFAGSDSDTGSDACSDDDFDAAAAAAEEDEPVVLSQAELKARNVQAMLSGSLTVARKPMVSGLKCQDVAAVLARPFRAPFAGAAAGHSAELARRLAARRRFVPWGSTTNAAAPGRPLAVAPLGAPGGAGASEPKEEPLPPGIEPLVLWEDNPANAEDGSSARAAPLKPKIEVDHMLVRFLRPHQREGVKFMFECVEGLRDFDGAGCILADDMGLGKTLQGITLLWTLLRQGVEGAPTVQRALIVCPTSLVSNWDDECNKWLKGRVKTMPVCESSRADVVSSVTRFLGPRNQAQVMIISYETFRIHAERFAEKGEAGVQLVMCDEAHRLKNGDTLTNKALCSVPCKRRVMLSGTPMQNHLDEFYAMVGFCNPGLLGTPSEFGRHYERPILAGREPDATEKQLELARERNAELSELVNKFVLRRTNTILSKHLPPKVVEVVCCKLAPLQTTLYEHFLESKAAKAALTGKHTMVLSAITALKKLCNHPKLIYDMVMGAKNTGTGAAGFESCREFFQPGMYDVGSGSGRGNLRGFGKGGMVDGWEFHSGKFAVLARLLAILRAETKDRIVIISNYTQTLDLVQLLCRQNGYPAVRLDGSTSISKRQKLVKQFNDPSENCFAFLLSSKAGGCGINLIGGNRLVLFDPDWNPANDKQAAARCWRDGQTKKCYLYRLLATGSIEEKVFQRQLSKESLQNVVNGEGTLEQASMSKEELRRLFTLNGDTTSDTHDNLAGGCAKCPGKHFQGHCHSDASGGGGAMELWEEQSDEPNEQNLETWGHHHRPDTIPDPVMRRAAGEDVSFTFSLQVEGCALVEKDAKKAAGGSGGAAGAAAKDGPPGSAATAAATAPAPAPAAYRLGAGFGARRPLAAVPANRAPAPAVLKPAGTAGRAGPTARPVAGAALPKPAAAKPKPKPKPARRGDDSDASLSSAFEDSDSDEEEASDSDDASAEDPPARAANGGGGRRRAASPAGGKRQTRASPRVASRRPARAAKKPALVEVDSSDTDDDDCVFREVLRQSAREEKRAKADSGDDAGRADSDAVEDSDAATDSDADPERRRRRSGRAAASPAGARKRPRRASAANRASGNAPAGVDAVPRAGVEVDAKRGRRSEGLGSVPDPSPSADRHEEDARSLTSASELCLGSPSSTSEG